MDKIKRELQHPIDKFSKSLIISNIEVMLNYCMRFYERQFVTREELNNGTMSRFELLLDPKLSAKQIAELLGFHYPQHFIRFFKKQTCNTPREYSLQHT